MSTIVGASCSITASELTFKQINITPQIPLPQSTITISIMISGGTPSDVRVNVEECNGRTGICFSDIQNVTMSPTTEGSYQTNVILKHADATYFNCTFAAQINGTWIQAPIWKVVNLTDETNGNTNGNGNNDNNKTPGFEMVLILLSIGIALIAIKRKRVK